MASEPASPAESTGDYAQIAPPPRLLVRYDVGALTHSGLCRENNEDRFLVARLERRLEVEATSLGPEADPLRSSEVGLLMIVADGMGGVGGGELASRIAVETLAAFALSGFRSFLHDDRADEHAVIRELKAGFERADRIIVYRAATEPGIEGMGTTLTMAYIVADCLLILHAGDSRAYLYREGALRQLSRDHSLVQTMVEQGILTPEDARTHPNRNVVTNVLGGPTEGVDVESTHVSLKDGDRIILCSDGLVEPVDDARIAAILGAEPDPGRAAATLVEEALRGGGPDNITVAIAGIRIEPPG